MRRRHDRHFQEGGEVEIPDVERFAVGELHVELLIEVAVEDSALPIDADGVTAHETRNRTGVKVLDEELVILGEFLVTLEIGGVARDSHVGDAVEIVEFDVEVLLHLTFVLSFEFLLWRGEEGSVGVVDEVELEVWLDAIAELIELLESSDGAIKNVVAALLVDVFGGVARHGGDAGDLVFGVEFGDPFVARLFDDGGVESGHDFAWLVEVTDSLDELAKIRVHLGSSSGEVEERDVCCLKPVDGAIEVFAGDEFLAMWASVDVAVNAGDVAELTEVELEDARSGASEGHLMLSKFTVEGVFGSGGRGAHGR